MRKLLALALICSLCILLNAGTTFHANQIRSRSGNSTTFATAAADLAGATAGSTACADGSGNVTTTGCSGGGGGGGANKMPFDSCNGDQTLNPGNATWRTITYTSSAGVSSADIATWEYAVQDASNPAIKAIGTVICKLEIPSNASGTMQVILDLASNDTTNGDTETFKVCYAKSSSQNINGLSYTCTATQNYSSTTTAYSNTRLTFSTTTPTIGEYLVANIVGTSVSNTAPVRMVAKVKVF